MDGLQNGTALGTIEKASTTVNALSQAIRHGSTRLGAIPGLLKQVIKDGLWHERQLPRSGSIEHYETFTGFVIDGLGTTVGQLRDLCRQDTEALALLEQVTQKGDGGDHRSEEYKTTLYNIQGDTAPTGTSSVATLRRLRKDRPDIHVRVIAGELSPNAGAIEAGFRVRKLQIDLNPEKAAIQLRKHFQGADLDALRRALA